VDPGSASQNVTYCRAPYGESLGNLPLCKSKLPEPADLLDLRWHKFCPARAGTIVQGIVNVVLLRAIGQVGEAVVSSIIIQMSGNTSFGQWAYKCRQNQGMDSLPVLFSVTVETYTHIIHIANMRPKYPLGICLDVPVD